MRPHATEQEWREQQAKVERWRTAKGSGYVDTDPPRQLGQASIFEPRRVEFVLPLPPSVNALYGIGKNGQKFLLDEQRQFRSQVIGIVRSELGRMEPLAGRLRLSLFLHQANNLRQDVSNRIKALEDALTHARVYGDDSQIDELMVWRIRGAREAHCRVVVLEVAA